MTQNHIPCSDGATRRTRYSLSASWSGPRGSQGSIGGWPSWGSTAPAPRIGRPCPPDKLSDQRLCRGTRLRDTTLALFLQHRGAGSPSLRNQSASLRRALLSVGLYALLSGILTHILPWRDLNERL